MKWTQKKQAVFLEVVRTTGNVSAGARAADAGRGQVYHQRRKDQAFRAEWDSALQGALDDLEGALRRRAVEGVEKAVYYGGEQCGTNISYSDNLGMFLLRGRRKEVFGDGKANAADSADIEISPNDASPRARLLAKLGQISKASRCKGCGGGET